MLRRLVKLSYDGKKLLARWSVTRPGGEDEHELLCHDAPKPELLDALKALRPSVATICELDSDYCADLEVRGASFSYGGERHVMGATITALKKLDTANAPLVL